MIELPLHYYAFSGLLNFVVCSAITIVIFCRHPRSAAARLFGFHTFLIAFWAGLYFLWLRTTVDQARANFLVRTLMISVILMPPVFIHFAATLTGRWSRRSGHLLHYLLSALLCPTVYSQAFSPGVAPHLVFPFWPLPGPIFLLHLSQISLSVVCGLWLIGSTALRSDGRFRIQLWWTFWAYLIGWLSGFTNYLPWFHLPLPPILTPLVSLYVIAIAYAIVRHQLLDIRVVIRKSVVYSLLIACITGSYLVAVLVMEKWFQGFFGYRSIFATAVVAFLIAVFFNPLRDRIQAFVDRALFKATPAELAEQREQLLTEVRKGEQMKAVATLAAGLAHEIKNPLASIKTFTDYLNARYADPEFRAKFQKIVGGEVERINLIVQQLLEFAKPVPPKLTPLELPRLLDETLEFLSGELVERQVEVTRRYEARPQVLGDPQQLKQVFLNLFLNSLQAMNGHGRLEIRTSVEGSEIIVTITDSGSGIAPKDLPHVFEPFYTTKTNGTGLGLAVVQGIIKEHGGRIAVESHPGQGTTMRLHLPIAV